MLYQLCIFVLAKFREIHILVPVIKRSDYPLFCFIIVLWLTHNLFNLILSQQYRADSWIFPDLGLLEPDSIQ